MPKVKKTSLKHTSHISKANILIFLIVFASIGSYLLYTSFAAPNALLPGDINNDNVVNSSDLTLLLANFGTSYPNADFNNNGSVDVSDFSTLLSHFGQSISGTSINIGETNLLSGDDFNNGSVLIADQSTLSQTATLQSMSLYVSQAAGNLRMGVYDATGPSGSPGNKLAETAETTPVVGWNTVNVTSPVSLPAGTYWLAYLSSDNNLHTKITTTAGSNYWYHFTYGAIPSVYSASASQVAGHASLYATLNTGSGPATPTASISASPTTINSGQSSTLTWSSTNATGCTASGAWSGSQSTSGSLSVSPTSTSTYTLTCTGAGGSSTPGNAVVTVSNGGIMHPTNGLGLDTAGSYPADYSNLSSYGLVIVSAQGVPTAQTLSALTLLYSDASQIVTFYTEGLSYSIASANGCLLTQVSTGRYVFDHSKASCNQLMADADVAYVKSNSMKGMFLDDTVPQNPYGTTTPVGWEAGMVSFVHLLHSELNANGLYLLTNANGFADPALGNGDNGAGDLNWALQLAPDGIFEESWMETRDGNYVLRASGPAWNQDWDGWQNTAKQIQAAGMDFVGMTYNVSTNHVPYSYASTQLANSGRAVYMPAHPDGSDPWDSIFARNLGTATTSVTQSGVGWYRNYTGGKVIVNTSPSSSATIDGQTLQLTTGYVGP